VNAPLPSGFGPDAVGIPDERIYYAMAAQVLARSATFG
jgi:hypothetical protein